jgi:outer membrane protein TolC
VEEFDGTMTKTSFVKHRTTFRAPFRAIIAAFLLLAALPLSAEPIDFRQAIKLALMHSGVMLGALADRTRASERYRAERYAYIPTVIFGSNLGFTYGPPVAIAGQAPSLFNVTHSQSVLNFAARESIKAAHSDALAADLDYAARAQQVILDNSLLYIELDNTQQRLAAAQEQKQAVDHALYIAQQRQQEGVGSALDSKHAELDAARVDFRITELETSIDVLRERLARAIGQSPATLATVSDSIPAAPPARGEQDISQVALANSATVRVADEHVRAAHDRARAQHKMNYPSIDLAGQYVQYASFNNYSTYYTNFPSRSYSVGINLRIPIFNLAQNALAAAADAEALKAEADAQTARDQVAADAIGTQHTLRQLEASARVSRLEFELAQANIDAVKLQVEEGHANARDQELARADIANRQVALLQSQFEYLRAQLQLLRQTGELHVWALGN